MLLGFMYMKITVLEKSIATARCAEQVEKALRRPAAEGTLRLVARMRVWDRQMKARGAGSSKMAPPAGRPH